MFIDSVISGRKSILDVRARPREAEVMQIIEQYQNPRSPHRTPKWVDALRSGDVEAAARGYVDQLANFRVLFLEGHALDSLALEFFYLLQEMEPPPEQAAKIAETVSFAVADTIKARVPPIALIEDTEPAPDLIANTYARLLCAFPSLSGEGKGRIPEQHDVLLAAYSSLNLSSAEYDQWNPISALLSMKADAPELMAKAAEELSRKTNDDALRDAFLNVSDRFISFAARLTHRDNTIGDAIPYPVVPDGTAKPCQIVHAICTRLGLPIEEAEELVVELFGFQSWDEMEELACDPDERKGPFDEDVPSSEFKERKRIQIGIMSALEIPESTAETLWKLLRPTSRVVTPSLRTFEPPRQT